MSSSILTTAEAAKRLGITVTTLYDWLGKSRYGILKIRGEPVVFEHFQSGPLGQGKITFEAAEVERIRNLMRVPQGAAPKRGRSSQHDNLPGIVVALGRPEF